HDAAGGGGHRCGAHRVARTGARAQAQQAPRVEQDPGRQRQQQPGRGRPRADERGRMGRARMRQRSGGDPGYRPRKAGALPRTGSAPSTRALRARARTLRGFPRGATMVFWLKVLHISAMVLWFTGLCFLPRLLVARHRGERDAAAGYFGIVANRVFFRIASPAALVAVASGMGLVATGPSGAWLVMKLVLVAAVVMLHLYMGVVLYELGQGRDRHGPAFYRIAGWTPVA